jgi:hypothetical protein
VTLSLSSRQLSVVATGFKPGERVSATVYSEPYSLGSATADSTGRVTFTATLPTSVEAGSHRVVLVGESTGTVEKTFTLTSSGTLAQTGAASWVLPAGLAGLLMLAFGGAGLRLAYRRRDPGASS